MKTTDMRTIKVGDKVRINWSYSEISDEGIVRHMPSDTGDMWYIDCDRFTMAVNPQSSSLQNILKWTEKP